MICKGLGTCQFTLITFIDRVDKHYDTLKYLSVYPPRTLELDPASYVGLPGAGMYASAGVGGSSSSSKYLKSN